MATPKDLLLQCMRGLERDIPVLAEVDKYLKGEHRDPYMPRLADDEYRLLAERCVTNLTPSLVNIPAQALYVDGVRSGREDGSSESTSTAHWQHWQMSRMDAGQSQVHRGALAYGHSFVLTELNDNKEVVSRGLSPMRTFALYEHPATDVDPIAVFTVTRWPTATDPGRGMFWDETHVYKVSFKGLTDDKPAISAGLPHGSDVVPVTRFAAAVDLEGRTVGVVRPMLVLQDRINQTVFDLLIAQSGGSFVTRTVTGMAPPMKMKRVEVEDPITGEVEFEMRPETDDDGNPVPEKIRLSASDFLYADNPEAKFGSLPGTPLDGYIASLNASLRHFTTISQTPPHYMLGEIANLSAEALQAAETSLSRKVAEFRVVFGESWERVFRVAAHLEGDAAAAEDFAAEVLWRDMEAQALSRTADALGKLAELLGIPKEGLWPRIPGVTAQEMKTWQRLKEAEPDAVLAQAMQRTEAYMTTPEGGEPASSASKKPAWSA